MTKGELDLQFMFLFHQEDLEMTSLVLFRTFYRFEVAWDSSLHNSALLNRVTAAKDWIYVTITCYLDIENCVQPACITKDLSLIFHPRDARVNLSR